jgi:spore maturation protein CgeB
MTSRQVLLIANPRPTHVGAQLMRAAPASGHQVELIDVEQAFAGPRLLRSLAWRLLGHRPLRLQAFSREVVRICQQQRPDLLLGTGFVPVTQKSLEQIRQLGISTGCFLTDDPWNPAAQAPWFMKALRAYDHVFTPRLANEQQLRCLGLQVTYLPFAYAPEEHFAIPEAEADTARWGGLVAFIGGADAERAAIMRVLDQAGLPLGLWGGYWAKQPGLERYAHGHTDMDTFRRVVTHAGVNLCLVRRANRDGHSMRSFELPAIGGCMLVEDTEEHRELFGMEGESVFYFSDNDTLVSQAKRMLALDKTSRQRLADSVRQRITRGRHCYRDRLEQMIETAIHPYTDLPCC